MTVWGFELQESNIDGGNPFTFSLKLIEDSSVLERALTKFRIFLHYRFSSA
jgi:hypothetical protein